jgi:hypothetical protein
LFIYTKEYRHKIRVIDDENYSYKKGTNIIGKGLNGKVYDGKLTIHSSGEEVEVAIKEYEG